MLVNMVLVLEGRLQKMGVEGSEESLRPRWVLSRCDKTSPRPAGGPWGVRRGGQRTVFVAPLDAELLVAARPVPPRFRCVCPGTVGATSLSKPPANKFSSSLGAASSARAPQTCRPDGAEESIWGWVSTKMPRRRRWPGGGVADSLVRSFQRARAPHPAFGHLLPIGCGEGMRSERSGRANGISN